ncbi:MAG: hypothetical protein HC818_01800 [Synechococcaceae cyanobacterium RM1_1_27]|nr:hypothetical protein [Synechococcaceae cyanobacterium RM1_1_27]
MWKVRIISWGLWIVGVLGYAQQRYLELWNEVEWWGAYDPELGGLVVYLLCVLPLGYLGNGIPAATLWQRAKTAIFWFQRLS